MHHKKRFLTSILFVILIVLSLSACSRKNTECKLSEMEDSELIQHMADSGVVIPESVDMDTIREIIVELENDPDHPTPVLGYTVITDLYEDIRNFVAENDTHGE